MNSLSQRWSFDLTARNIRSNSSRADARSHRCRARIGTLRDNASPNSTAGTLTITERIASSLGTILWRRHARREAEKDHVSETGLENALRGGFALVEHYQEDPYGESALVLVFIEGKPVHVVLSPRESLCYIVTVYVPDPTGWDQTFTRRDKK